jgi:serine/threonine-protein kinase
MTGITVVVADDSTLVREGVARLLRDEGFDVVGETKDLDELIACVRLTRPDLVVTDIRMPPGRSDEGIVAAGIIREETGGQTAVLVLSQYLDLEFALRVLESGDRAIGYVLKDRIVDAAAFVDAARRVTRGETIVDPAIVSALLTRSRRPGPLDTLSTRERDVLGLMAEGRSNSGIAERLYLTEKTVEGYVSAIFAKLGLEAGPDDHRRVLAVLSYLGDRPRER